MSNFVSEANRLGFIIDALADMTKNLNVKMLSYDETRPLIDPIIGMGKFNRAITETPGKGKLVFEDDTVLYGDELRAARTNRPDQPHHGLFAALAPVHHPLLAMAQRVSIDLGHKGFTCNINHNGEDYSIPLHMMKITFDDQGVITTTNDITAGGKTLPKGTRLASHSHSMGYGNFSGDIRGMQMHCTIADAGGKPLDKDLAVTLLWLNLASQGKNIYGEGSPKDNVLARVGVDDMETANSYLIKTIKQLEQSHGYDSDPLYRELKESAATHIKPHLPSLAIAREIISQLIQNSTPNMMASVMGSLHHYKLSTIDDVTSTFNLTLPALTPEQQAMATTVANTLCGKLQMKK